MSAPRDHAGVQLPEVTTQHHQPSIGDGESVYNFVDTVLNMPNRAVAADSDGKLKLYRAALRGDWKDANDVHGTYPNCFTQKISTNGGTALHIAAVRGHLEFVRHLLKTAKLTEAQLMEKDNVGNTALCLAAASGVIEIVRELEEKSPQLASTPGSDNMSPILIAALLGHRAVVKHLFHRFRILKSEEQVDLLISTINTDLYDVALDILGEKQDLALGINGNSKTALHVLAEKTTKMSRSTKGKSLKQYCNTLWFCNQRMEQSEECAKKHELVNKLWEIVTTNATADQISKILSISQVPLLFRAIEVGNYEFFVTSVRWYPDLIWNIDKNKRTIFHVAVQYRQEKIFSHIHQLSGINHLLTACTDPHNGNNILHLAAILPPTDRLNVVSGPALQMQRELLWFQEVKRVIRREYFDLNNSPKPPNSHPAETPQELFTREHRQLRKEGEKWMRETANSCMLVATIIASVAFAAAFQPPKADNKIMYWIFAISDASSLLASTTSMLIFLAILTARYAEEDFLKSLPLKLMAGLASLSLAMMTVLIAFTSTIAIIFPHKFMWITMAISTWFIGGFYLWQFVPLLCEVYRSTFGYDCLFRPQQQLFVMN